MRPRCATSFLQTLNYRLSHQLSALTMPSLDNVSHLLTICAEAPEAFNWVVWQDRTGLTVMPFGPNSSYDIVGLEQTDFDKALIFFIRWKQESGSQKRLTFIRGRTDAFQDGRVTIKKWAGDRWTEWGISEVVGQVLDNYGFKMFEFTKALKRDQVFCSASVNILFTDLCWQWPNASDIGIREVAADLALSMFGPDSVVVVGRITVVHAPLVPVVQGLLTSAWDSKGRAWRRRGRVRSRPRTSWRRTSQVGCTVPFRRPQADLCFQCLRTPGHSPPRPRSRASSSVSRG